MFWGATKVPGRNLSVQMKQMFLPCVKTTWKDVEMLCRPESAVAITPLTDFLGVVDNWRSVLGVFWLTCTILHYDRVDTGEIMGLFCLWRGFACSDISWYTVFDLNRVWDVSFQGNKLLMGIVYDFEFFLNICASLIPSFIPR